MIWNCHFLKEFSLLRSFTTGSLRGSLSNSIKIKMRGALVAAGALNMRNLLSCIVPLFSICLYMFVSEKESYRIFSDLNQKSDFFHSIFSLTILFLINMHCWFYQPYFIAVKDLVCRLHSTHITFSASCLNKKLSATIKLKYCWKWHKH